MEDPCGTNESTDPKFGNGPSENDNGGKKKRREQNRVAQKRYRKSYTPTSILANVMI